MLLTNEDKDFIKEKYSWLTIYWDYSLKWVISFSVSYNEVKKIFTINGKWNNLLKWKYEININFFPNKFPEIYEINWDFERWINSHIYEDWKFCLTHTLYEEKYKNKDFKFILEELIIPFLYNQTYNIEHWKFLWEYWHWIEWTFEYVAENNLSKREYLIILKDLKKYIGKNKKLFLYSKNERTRLIDLLKLQSKKSKIWFMKFIDFLKRHTNLFNKT